MSQKICMGEWPGNEATKMAHSRLKNVHALHNYQVLLDVERSVEVVIHCRSAVMCIQLHVAIFWSI